MVERNIENMIITWGRQNQPIVREIYVIGSRGKDKKQKKLPKKSDLDLMIFIDDDMVPDSYYDSLAEIGLEVGLLIHPLFLLEKNKESMLRIKEYSDALVDGRKIL